VSTSYEFEPEPIAWNIPVTSPALIAATLLSVRNDRSVITPTTGDPVGRRPDRVVRIDAQCHHGLSKVWQM
jgi:hypothetical protein